METIRAIVTRVLSSGTPEEDTGRVLFLAQYETPEGLVAGKFGGRARGLRPGDCVACEGDWDESRTFRGRPDTLFRARQIRPDVPRTVEGVELFLKQTFNEAEHGIPPQALSDFVKRRGAAAFRQSTENPELIVALSEGPARFRSAILEAWSARTQGSQAVSLMETAGVAAKAIGRIIGELREAPLRLLRENPYRVSRIPDVGFDNADRIGMKLGFARDDRKRLTAAVTEVLHKRETEGSTCANLDELLEGLSAVSRIDRGIVLDFLKDAAHRKDHDIAIYETGTGDPPVAAPLRLYVAEVDILRGVRTRLEGGRSNDPAAVGALAEALFARDPFRRLDAVQRAAVEMAATEPLSVITGGPGTGKSTVMDAVARLCEQLDPGSLFLVAPTGKASKRLEETTRRKASTIHRLLGARGREGGVARFRFDRSNPLPGGCVVVVDETSMQDVEITAALFNAMPADGRVILVGDRNQLASVGAGAVLADLLGATSGGRPLVPSVELVKVYRQSEDSGIAKGAVLIKDGSVPDIGPEDRAGVSFRDVPEQRLVDAVERLVCEELPRQGLDPVRDVAVLCPMAPGPGGTWQVNARLSARLNPDGAVIPGVARGENDPPQMPVPRCGDRVMLTENDVEHDVMNGDVGTIVGVGTANRRPTFRVRFDSGPEVDYPAVRWRSLILAYAGTIHKSQGSQYKAVVMPMTAAHARMLERTLVYTGWTRAQKRLVLMGERAAFESGVRTHRGRDRSTLLGRLVAGLPFPEGRRDWHRRAAEAAASLSGNAPPGSGARRAPTFAPLFGGRTRTPDPANDMPSMPAPMPVAPGTGSAASPRPPGTPRATTFGGVFGTSRPSAPPTHEARTPAPSPTPAAITPPPRPAPSLPSLFGAARRPAAVPVAPPAAPQARSPAQPQSALPRRPVTFGSPFGKRPVRQEEEETPPLPSP